MSGTWPSSPKFNAINFQINTPTLVTNTLSGLTRRIGMGHSFYSFTVKYNNISRYDMGPIIGFIAEQYGPLEKFQIVLPEISYTKVGNQTTTIVVSAQGTYTGPTTTITIGTDTWTDTTGTHTGYLAGSDHIMVSNVASGKNLLRAGDFFKFANHDKVYMCTTTWTTGNPLYFSGSLVKNVPNGTALVIDQVPFTVILNSTLQQVDVGIGGITQIQLDMKEAW